MNYIVGYTDKKKTGHKIAYRRCVLATFQVYQEAWDYYRKLLATPAETPEAKRKLAILKNKLYVSY